METILRNIIKKEIRLTLMDSYMPVPTPVDSVEDIIYDFEAGKSFGINKLSLDIKGLEEYYMNSYFPRSEMQENWMFEIETNYGGFQVVEITHTLKEDYESYWELRISDVERGSDTPVITHETGFIKGYKNFINKVNSTLEKQIDPNFL